MSSQVYLSTSPRKKRLRSVPFSRMISARSTQRRVVHEQRAALAADDVLRLVEAESAEVAERAKRPAVVGATGPARRPRSPQAVVARRCSASASISHATPA